MTDIGFLITLAASIIALYGVWLFNQKRDYTRARVVWMVGNPLFTFYFLGRIMMWWDGGLGDGAMLVYFGAMAVSNWKGMK